LVAGPLRPGGGGGGGAPAEQQVPVSVKSCSIMHDDTRQPRAALKEVQKRRGRYICYCTLLNHAAQPSTTLLGRPDVAQML
jgi:hypothetical protein